MMLREMKVSMIEEVVCGRQAKSRKPVISRLHVEGKLLGDPNKFSNTCRSELYAIEPMFVWVLMGER